MANFLFTSEAVSMGHPDKIADQISDAIVDACLADDKESRVACETLVAGGLVILAGQITTTAQVDYQAVVRQTIREIGYDDCALGFDWRSCGILIAINKQSPDISRGIEGQGVYKGQGAGDQGFVFGFACDETPSLMPLTAVLSLKIVDQLRQERLSGRLPYLRPDAKSQVTVEYSEDYTPERIHTVVVSTQHTEGVSHVKICRDVKAMVKKLSPKGMIDKKTLFYINPTGRFVIGGPVADCGLTGRKPVVDTYGGMGRHGGGSFSGKDGSKVDRSAAYAARHVAKNIVAAKLARRCEVQISYAIGVPYPISIKVDTFGTGKVNEDLIAGAIPKVFDLTPKGIVQRLKLKRPIYRQTAYGGHFGRVGSDFTWEKTDCVKKLLKALG